MKKIAVIAALIGAVWAVAAAGAMKGSADVVKVSATPAAVTAAAGDEVAFAVKVDIQDPWHLYAHGDTNFIGIDLVPAEDVPLADFTAEYPAGQEGEFFGEKVWMVDGLQSIEAKGTVPADLPHGEHMLEFKVTAQACDDKTCLAPAYLPVRVKLVVE